MDYDRLIAKTGLEIGAIKLWPKDGPFLWHCGKYMPIYNDNRKFLGRYEHRMLVGEGLVDIIKKNGLEPDIIAGTSTAGLAPAATVAQMLGLPFAMQHGGEVYVFSQELLEAVSVKAALDQHYDLLASTCPFAIAPSVMDANAIHLPFAYVRSEKKDHGMMNQIEGVYLEGQVAFLIDYSVGRSYVAEAKKALEDKGVVVDHVFSDDFSSLGRPKDVAGKKILQIEDLVSTGGSCVDEIQLYRSKGAIVTHCLSIFSYGLEKALEMFRQAAVILLPRLEYPLLLEEAVALGTVGGDSLKTLKEEWRPDPFNWGERHGFPSKKK